MSDKRKFFKQHRQPFDPLDDGSGSQSVILINIRENVFDFGKSSLGPSKLHAR
jgi:hypothetical protein